MRLWSLHPALLDSKGLVALWREALLAQHVLHGKTKGYRAHPQLDRFYACEDPKKAIATYLLHVQEEAAGRDYNFDKTKIMSKPAAFTIPVQKGQVAFERAHLDRKLKERDPKQLSAISRQPSKLHPLFSLIAGDIESWERV